jgi:CheY-like chemotaxis protein
MADDPRYKKVLLIDDNTIDNFVNKKLLEMTGFSNEVVVHESAASALDYLKGEKKDNLPEVIFLDIMMPGMDGFAFIDEFQKLGKVYTDNCKIVMLSTSESFQDLNRANKNPHVRKFLNKPLTESVVAAINL